MLCGHDGASLHADRTQHVDSPRALVRQVPGSAGHIPRTVQGTILLMKFAYTVCLTMHRVPNNAQVFGLMLSVHSLDRDLYRCPTAWSPVVPVAAGLQSSVQRDGVAAAPSVAWPRASFLHSSGRQQSRSSGRGSVLQQCSELAAAMQGACCSNVLS